MRAALSRHAASSALDAEARTQSHRLGAGCAPLQLPPSRLGRMGGETEGGLPAPVRRADRLQSARCRRVRRAWLFPRKEFCGAQRGCTETFIASPLTTLKR